MTDDEIRVREIENRLYGIELSAQRARQTGVAQAQAILLLTQAGGRGIPPPTPPPGWFFPACNVQLPPSAAFTSDFLTGGITVNWDSGAGQWVGGFMTDTNAPLVKTSDCNTPANVACPIVVQITPPTGTGTAFTLKAQFKPCTGGGAWPGSVAPGALPGSFVGDNLFGPGTGVRSGTASASGCFSPIHVLWTSIGMPYASNQDFGVTFVF